MIGGNFTLTCTQHVNIVLHGESVTRGIRLSDQFLSFFQINVLSSNPVGGRICFKQILFQRRSLPCYDCEKSVCGGVEVIRLFRLPRWFLPITNRTNLFSPYRYFHEIHKCPKNHSHRFSHCKHARHLWHETACFTTRTLRKIITFLVIFNSTYGEQCSCINSLQDSTRSKLFQSSKPDLYLQFLFTQCLHHETGCLSRGVAYMWFL